jgi:hypothetical protein
MGLVSWGDASINAAKNAGQIKQVASVDFDTVNVLAIYGSFCTVVKLVRCSVRSLSTSRPCTVA